MSYDEFPNPLIETRAWVAINRPDVLREFDSIQSIDQRTAAALEFLIAVAFAAGKEYGEKKAEADRVAR